MSILSILCDREPGVSPFVFPGERLHIKGHKGYYDKGSHKNQDGVAGSNGDSYLDICLYGVQAQVSIHDQ